jgi:hypothetical protein
MKKLLKTILRHLGAKTYQNLLFYYIIAGTILVLLGLEGYLFTLIGVYSILIPLTLNEDENN